MADTLPITSSLFGISPESLQAQRQAVQEAQAMRFAQLDPAERATYGFYRAGQQTGNALAGLMGAQDPELEAVKLVQSLGAQYDKTTPEGLGQLAQALQATGNPYAQQFALQAADRANQLALQTAKIGSENALIQQRLREKAAADPLQKIITSGKYTAESIAKYQQSGNIADLENTEKADPTALTETAEGVLLVNKKTGQVISNLGKAPDRRTVVNAGVQIPKQGYDLTKGVVAFDNEVKPEVARLESAQLAKSLISETAKTNNPQAWEAARTTIAKAVGENKLSNEDIRRTGTDPALVAGALDWISKKTTSIPTAETQKQLFRLASILEKDATTRYNAKASRLRSAAVDSEFKGDVKTYFPLANERSGASSGAVDFNSLK